MTTFSWLLHSYSQLFSGIGWPVIKHCTTFALLPVDVPFTTGPLARDRANSVRAITLTWYSLAQQGPLKQIKDDLRRHMQLTMHGLMKDLFCLLAGSPGLVTLGDPSPGLDPECQRSPSGFYLSSLLPRLILTTCLLSSTPGNFTVFCSYHIFYLFCRGNGLVQIKICSFYCAPSLSICSCICMCSYGLFSPTRLGSRICRQCRFSIRVLSSCRLCVHTCDVGSSAELLSGVSCSLGCWGLASGDICLEPGYSSLISLGWLTSQYPRSCSSFSQSGGLLLLNPSVIDQ